LHQKPLVVASETGRALRALLRVRPSFTCLMSHLFGLLNEKANNYITRQEGLALLWADPLPAARASVRAVVRAGSGA
jgi:hypothetical protein